MTLKKKLTNIREATPMYHKTIEEEQKFLWSLWDVFDAWVSKKHPNAELGTEIVESDLKCPKCGIGKIINYGTVEVYRGDLRSFSMRHICENCQEEFDRIKINEDIYENEPYEMLQKLETPLGSFCVSRNNEIIPFRYRQIKTDVHGMEMIKHLMDIDTSFMKKDDMVFAGIKGAGLVYLDGDERCSYRSAENEEWFLVLNGEEINNYEVDIEDYSFITEEADENGYSYLIHRDPASYRNEPSHFCRVISLCLAWGKKNMCEDYEKVIEETVW